MNFLKNTIFNYVSFLFSLTGYSSRLVMVPVRSRIFPNAHNVTALLNGLRRSNSISSVMYRGADKSLARPGRKQSQKHARDARDFNNIQTRTVIKFFFPARQAAEGNSRHSDRNISLFPS